MPQVSSAFVADPELIEQLERRAEPVAVGADRVIFRQGGKAAGVYLVRNGSVMLTSQSDGDAILRVEAGAGSLLGVPAVIGAKPYSLTAEALEGAELSLINSEDFVHVMNTEPQLAFRVLQVLAAEVRFAREAFSHL